MDNSSLEEDLKNMNLDCTDIEKASLKRTDYLDWAEYFMATAFLAAKRSKDPKTQVGACIVNEFNRIVGVGYNGMPNGCDDDEFPWAKSDDPLESKFSYVCHAELNAVLNKNSSDVQGCTMYVVLFPCNECAKVLIQAGIKQVIYMSDKNALKKETIAAKKMLDAAGVKYIKFEAKRRRVVIDFSELGQICPNNFKDAYQNLAEGPAYSEKRSDVNL